jgi:sec-independent protein translocase protein TatA
MSVGPTEFLIVLVIFLLLFGASRLPRLARSLGQAQHEFRRGFQGELLDPPDAASDQEAADPS